MKHMAEIPRPRPANSSPEEGCRSMLRVAVLFLSYEEYEMRHKVEPSLETSAANAPFEARDFFPKATTARRSVEPRPIATLSARFPTAARGFTTTPPRTR